MPSCFGKILTAACLVGASTVGAIAFAPVAHASSAVTDHLAPENTTVALSEPAAGFLTMNIDNNFVNFTVSCTTVTMSFPIGPTGSFQLGSLLPQGDGQPVDFGSCTDDLGGTDTIVTAGNWTANFKDAKTGDTEPNTDKVVLHLPSNAMTLQTSAIGGCVLTFNPGTAISNLAAGYNDKGTATIKAGTSFGTVAPSGASCPFTSVTETNDSDHLKASVAFHDVVS